MTRTLEDLQHELVELDREFARLEPRLEEIRHRRERLAAALGIWNQPTAAPSIADPRAVKIGS